ncbi:hypothetical protein PILCRDRAFT_583461 [Piloderma croceum F 1598]|uniref:Uncharacterized protein n=1 Tax=Piloderma croceum (strain F 1598) TaxID=765440 RepID=A0A0C3FG23_PILCF|nr:hypothetical protein PILCRDRAFT_583461 [Piloderma croceum F 1598]
MFRRSPVTRATVVELYSTIEMVSKKVDRHSKNCVLYQIEGSHRSFATRRLSYSTTMTREMYAKKTINV